MSSGDRNCIRVPNMQSAAFSLAINTSEIIHGFLLVKQYSININTEFSEI